MPEVMFTVFDRGGSSMEAADISNEVDFNKYGEEEDEKSSFFEELLFGVEGTQKVAINSPEIKSNHLLFYYATTAS